MRDESIASIDDVELRNEDKTAASLLVSMKSEVHDSLLAKAGKDQTNNSFENERLGIIYNI